MTDSQTIADQMLESVEGWTPPQLPKLPEIREDPKIFQDTRLSDFWRAYKRLRKELFNE